jgi:hypothetical protein
VIFDAPHRKPPIVTREVRLFAGDRDEKTHAPRDYNALRAVYKELCSENERLRMELRDLQELLLGDDKNRETER